MKKQSFCPHCNDLIELEFSSDYYMTKEGEIFDTIKCPKCDLNIALTWEVQHNINFEAMK